MEQPAVTASKPTETERSIASGDATQALMSAVVFGALGSLAGNWLGGKGGEHGPRMFGQKVMTWIGGLAAGIVAAYVSLKTTSQQAEAPVNGETVVIKKPLMDAKPQMISMQEAEPQILAESASRHGTTVQKNVERELT